MNTEITISGDVPAFSTHDLFFSNGYKAAMDEMAKRRCGTCRHLIRGTGVCSHMCKEIKKVLDPECGQMLYNPYSFVAEDWSCPLWEKKDA